MVELLRPNQEEGRDLRVAYTRGPSLPLEEALVEYEVSALAQVLPASLIRDALKETGRTTKRNRKLPAELTA